MHDKIIKLLNMTTSDNDHEALTAMRMVNAILKKNNVAWEQLFLGKAKDQDMQDLDAQELINFIRRNAWDGFDFSFVESLERQLKNNKTLSLKQKMALRRIYNTLQS